MENIIKEYKEYVDKFYKSDSRINYKWNHSLRVMEKMQLLSKDLNQDEKDYFLSSIIGLFHDFGRFHQLDKYDTYEDNIFDHGDYGADELIKNYKLKDFVREDVEEDIIYDAVKNHNKYSIDPILNERNMLFSKMIQDADKVDILESVAKGLIEFKDDDSKISDEVKEYFDNYKLLLSNLRKTNNDRMIGFLCFIYDLHFTWSYKYLFEHKVFNKIYNNLNNKEIFKYYFEEIDKFLKKKIGE